MKNYKIRTIMIYRFKDKIISLTFGDGGIRIRINLHNNRQQCYKDQKRINLNFIRGLIKIEIYLVYVMRFMMTKNLLLLKITITIDMLKIFYHIFVFPHLKTFVVAKKMI